jgi:hypothetical protein
MKGKETDGKYMNKCSSSLIHEGLIGLIKIIKFEYIIFTNNLTIFERISILIRLEQLVEM